jgi:hypothetical protein
LLQTSRRPGCRRGRLGSLKATPQGRFVSLLFAIAVPACAGALTVTPESPDPVLEGINVSVAFHVFNTTGSDLILDYALAIINGPPGDATDTDNVFFGGGQSFPTVILNNTGGDFKYNLLDPNDPTDAPDNGLNNISFYLGMSVWNGVGKPGIITVPGGLGMFFYNGNGVGSTGTLQPGTLAILNNCFNNPGNFPNPCPTIGANKLYTGEFQGQPFPAVATVTVNDLPEPSTWGVVFAGIITLACFARRIRQAIAVCGLSTAH